MEHEGAPGRPGRRAGDPPASSGAPSGNTPFDDILDALERHAGEDSVSVGAVRRELGEKSFGAMMLLPALLEISPIGGIPGVPTLLALIIVLIAAQVLLGRDTLWLPGFLERRAVDGDRLAGAVEFMRRPALFIDRHFHDRMDWLTTPPLDKVVALVCIVLAASVPPLELFPFASTIPMAGIALLGLALLFDDGLLVLAGLVLAAATVGTGIYLAL